MRENKTKQTDASVEAYFDAIADDQRRKDCRALSKLMAKVSKHEPRMWGTGIVGFGSYHYKYESGREGDSCVVGFASRKGDITVYLTSDFPDKDRLLEQLGRHKVSKGCLYIRTMSDVKPAVLEQLVASAIGAVEAKYGR